MPPASATHSTIIRWGMINVQVFVRQLNGIWVHAVYGYQVYPMIEPETLRHAGGRIGATVRADGSGPNRESGR